MNPFVLLSIAVTAIFGAWHSVIPISYTLNLLVEPIPHATSTPTIHTFTISAKNLSLAPLKAGAPSFSYLHLFDTPSQSVGPFPQDLRTVSTLSATNQGADDLQILGFGDITKVSRLERHYKHSTRS